MRRFESSRPSQYIQRVIPSALSSFRLSSLPPFRLLASFRSQISVAAIDVFCTRNASCNASIHQANGGPAHVSGSQEAPVRMTTGRERYVVGQDDFGASLLHEVASCSRL